MCIRDREYPWPGNVRELIHALERACLAAGHGDLILPQHLPTQMRVTVARRRVGEGRKQSTVQEAPMPEEMPGRKTALDAGLAKKADLPSLRAWKARAEEEYVRRVMAVSAGDARRAASLAGISRGHWYELIKKYRV